MSCRPIIPVDKIIWHQVKEKPTEPDWNQLE